MSLLVMKFGGTSVADIDRMKKVADRIISKKKRSNKVIVIVYAPGNMTDDLIKRANEITDVPDVREMDMLLATGEQISVALLSIAIAMLFLSLHIPIKSSRDITGPCSPGARCTRSIPIALFKKATSALSVVSSTSCSAF